MSEAETKVKQIICDQLGVAPGEISDETYLIDDLNADQLAVADIVVSLEEEFHLEIPQEESIKFNTIGDIVMYVSDKLNEV